MVDRIQVSPDTSDFVSVRKQLRICPNASAVDRLQACPDRLHPDMSAVDRIWVYPDTSDLE